MTKKPGLGSLPREETLDLRQYADVIRENWWVILVFALAGAAGAYFYASRQPKVYRADAELVLENARFTVAVQTDYLSYNPWDETFVRTHTRILQSRSLALEAARLLLPALTAEGTSAPPAAAAAALPPTEDGVARALALTAEERAALADVIGGKDAEAVAGMIQAGLEVDVISKTRVLTVAMRSGSPAFAAAAVNALACAYEKHIAGAFAGNAHRTFEILRTQADATASNIENSTRQLLDLKRKSEVALLSTSAVAGASGPAQEASIRERLSQNDAEVSRLAGELLQIEQDIRTKAERYQPKHPDLLALQQKRDLLTNQLEEARTRLYVKWQTDHAREVAAVEYGILEEEVQAGRRLYELIIGKMKDVDFSKNTSEVTLRILKPATVPGGPVAPQPARDAATGGAVGVAVGLVLALIRSNVRSHLVSSRTPEDTLPVRFLGFVPFAKSQNVINALASVEAESHLSESTRALRTTVSALLRKNGGTVVLMTSPARWAGKTTVTSALALSLARAGSRVLVMDFDLRRGRLHTVFGAENKEGLSQLLRGAAHPEPLEVEKNLWIYPRGASTTSSSELLIRGPLASLLTDLRGRFDVILQDTPPLLSVTDASLLAEHADVRLLVARSMHTRRQELTFCANIFAQIGLSFDGVILNAVREEERGYYGYYRYYYYGRYDAKRPDSESKKTPPQGEDKAAGAGP